MGGVDERPRWNQPKNGGVVNRGGIRPDSLMRKRSNGVRVSQSTDIDVGRLSTAPDDRAPHTPWRVASSQAFESFTVSQGKVVRGEGSELRRLDEVDR